MSDPVVISVPDDDVAVSAISEVTVVAVDDDAVTVSAPSDEAVVSVASDEVVIADGGPPPPHDHDGRYYSEGEVDVALATKADLDAGGKVPSSQLPALAISDISVVASESAMLSLIAQGGDMAKRTDINRTFVLIDGGDPSVLADWVEISASADVSSVFGRVGDVLAEAGDYDGYYLRHDAAQGLTSTAQERGRSNLGLGKLASSVVGALAILSGSLAADRTFTLPDASGTVALQSYVDIELAAHAAAADPHGQYRLESADVPWSDISGTPTTLGGYGITDAASDAELAAHAGATHPWLDASQTWTANQAINAGLFINGYGGGQTIFNYLGHSNYLTWASAGACAFRHYNGSAAVDIGRWGTTGLRVGDGATASYALDVAGSARATGNLIAEGGLVYVGGGAGLAQLNISGGATSGRSVVLRTAGSARWWLGADPGGEPGGDAGSALRVYAYDDAGQLIDGVLAIQRQAGGLIELSRPVQMGQSLTVSGVVKSTVGGISLATPGAFLAESAVPAYAWRETDAADIDEQRWDISAAGGVLRFRAVNAGVTAAHDWMLVYRQAASVWRAELDAELQVNGAINSQGLNASDGTNFSLLRALSGRGRLDFGTHAPSALSLVMDWDHDDARMHVPLGIGIAPSYQLDVMGSVRLDGVVSIVDTTEASSLFVASTVISGGAAVAKKLRVGGDAHVDGNTFVAGQLYANAHMTSATSYTGDGTQQQPLSASTSFAQATWELIACNDDQPGNDQPVYRAVVLYETNVGWRLQSTYVSPGWDATTFAIDQSGKIYHNATVSGTKYWLSLQGHYA